MSSGVRESRKTEKTRISETGQGFVSRCIAKSFHGDSRVVAQTTWDLTKSYWGASLFVFISNFSAALMEGSTLAIFGLAIKILIGEDHTSFASLLGSIGIYIDQMAGAMDRETMFLIMIFMALGTVFVKVTSQFAAAATTAYMDMAVYKDVWNGIFRQFMTMEFAHISRYKSGDLNRYINDAGGISSWLRHLNKMLGTILMLGVYTVMLLYMSWKMSIIAFVMLGTISLMMNWLIKKIRKLAKVVLNIGIARDVQCLEYINSIRLLRIFVREDYAAAKMREVTGLHVKKTFIKNIWSSLIKPIMQLSSVSAVAAIILLSYYYFMVTTDQSVWPRLLTFLVVLNRMGPMVTQFNNRRAEIHAAYPGVLRVNNMLREDDKAYVRSGGIPFDGLKNEITFENVSLTYNKGERPAVENLSFVIPQGKMVAFIGESGAGKSTTADLLLRLYDPTEGKILVDGIDQNLLDLKSWREKIGVVSQETFIYNASIRENISFGRFDATDEEIVAAAKASHAHEFIMEMTEGYSTVVGDRGYRLSGGQRQRIAIARAILRNPPIYILDEATSSLDSASEQLIMNAISSIRKGRTLVAIAHRLSTVCMADCINVMRAGKIVESGTHDELIKKNGMYALLWRTQSESGKGVDETPNEALMMHAGQ